MKVLRTINEAKEFRSGIISGAETGRLSVSNVPRCEERCLELAWNFWKINCYELVASDGFTIPLASRYWWILHVRHCIAQVAVPYATRQLLKFWFWDRVNTALSRYKSFTRRTGTTDNETVLCSADLFFAERVRDYQSERDGGTP